MLTRVTSEAIANDVGTAFGAAWANYNNDDNLDLFAAVSGRGDDWLYHNNGNGVFTKITSGGIVTSAGAGNNSTWGDYPQYIQWYRDGVMLPGANGTGYTIPSVTYPNNNGARFYAVIRNSLCSATSSVAQLTVVADQMAPTSISAVGGLDPTKLVVTFSKAIEPAINESTFTQFPVGGNPDGPEALLAYSVIRTNNNTTVIVTIDPRATGESYSLRVTQVLDASSQQNSLRPDPTIVLSSRRTSFSSQRMERRRFACIRAVHATTPAGKECCSMILGGASRRVTAEWEILSNN